MNCDNQMKLSNPFVPTLILLLFVLCTACDRQVTPSAAATATTANPTAVVSNQANPTISPPAVITIPTGIPEESTNEMIPALWISPEVPRTYVDMIKPDWNYRMAVSGQDSNLSLVAARNPARVDHSLCVADWIYAVVAPFPTIVDEIDLRDLHQAWFGNQVNKFGNSPLLLSPETYELFKNSWGVPASGGIQIVDEGALIELAWEERSWAVIPFDQLEPRWKVIAVDGMTPLDASFDGDHYPLRFQICLTATEGLKNLNLEDYQADLHATNRDPDKMTSLVLTGTTALVRNVANKMEINGLTYPAEKIGSLLQEADILHISNEASFFEDCPPAVPVYRESRFCSNPGYLELLKYIGADIIEITGNHLFDWGNEPFLDTLKLYKENALPFYGGGANLEQARQPVLLEHNGNKLAFIGCSPAGPANVWATEDEPGTATCDFEWVEKEIESQKKAGYLTIFTFQHFESDDYIPHSSQRVDFTRVSEAGAEIVSGSQAHFPQSMTFVDGRFIHYGLGNLFFDQMEPLKRNQFIDRHIIYEGRHISTVLLTNIMEDYAQPRPMLPEERTKFLNKIFAASGW